MQVSHGASIREYPVVTLGRTASVSCDRVPASDSGFRITQALIGFEAGEFRIIGWQYRSGRDHDHGSDIRETYIGLLYGGGFFCMVQKL